MPKVTHPLFSESASGSVSPCLTFSLRNSGQQVRYQRKQKDKITAPRSAERAIYSAAVSAWNLLSNLEKEIYIGRTIGKHLTGFNLFVKEYILAENLAIYSYHGVRGYGIFSYGFEE